MTARPEFGVARLPRHIAEDAPAWPPLKVLAIDLGGTSGEADPGISQVEFGDGVWHRYGRIADRHYVAGCGASAYIGESRSRVTGEPTCADYRCTP